ncbi:MAG: hypothetical protein RSA10_04115, partial [Bacilli bacterium]
KEFLKYVYNNIYSIIIAMIDNKYILDFINTLPLEYKNYIIKRNQLLYEKQESQLLKILDKKYLITASDILYGIKK